MLYSNIINQVSLLGSSVCNLSCEYCYLRNRETQKFYKKLNEEIQSSWIDHSYVDNIKKVFKKIQANPNKTMRLTLWGGEPLIQVDNLLQSINDFFDFFPYANFFMVPTNFAWPEKIAKQIPQVILYFDQTRKIDNATFHLQLSIDGYEGPLLEQGHQAKNSQYLKNFEVFISELSKIELKNTKVIFDIHPTAAGKNILTHLYSYEQLEKYFDGMFFLKKYVDDLIQQYDCEDRVIYGESPYFPLCAAPENSTVDEGYKYSEIMRKAEKIQYDKQYVHESVHFFQSFCCNWKNSSLLTENHECPESNHNAITILPDGTLSECACSYVSNRQEYLDLILQQEQYEDYRLAITRKKYFFNPLTATKEEDEFNDWYNLLGVHHNFSTGLNLSMGLCQELSLSKQISPIYAMNPMLLLKHLRQETTPYSCPREQLSTTGIPHLPIPGDYRRMFNGEIEYANSVVNNEYNLIVKDWMMNDSNKQ